MSKKEAPTLRERHGRKTPYTEIGVRRLPCVRCGKKSHCQWNICADNRLFRPICRDCDIALNELVLKWAKDPEWKQKMEAYTS